MLISIICASLNSEKTIGSALESVFVQDFDDFELIIKDGGSKDKTLEVALTAIETYGVDDKVKIISGVDSGIYEAFNKGVDGASGDYVMFLNSDDRFASSGVLSEVSSSLLTKCVDILVGSITINDPKFERIIRRWDPPYLPSDSALCLVQIPHTGVICRRNLVSGNNGFDESYAIAGDFEWILRTFQRGLTIRKFEGVIVQMASGGASQFRFGSFLRILLEDLRALKSNHLSVWLLFVKKFVKINQRIGVQ